MSKYPIHLCQPDFSKSCGACCGLYNWADHSRATLAALLRSRTDLFFSLGNDPDLTAYRRLAESFSPGAKLLETIYNCEFLGFVDPERRRVGCLLHPSVHGGLDLRDRSFYGAELCAGHFCPSFTYLNGIEQAAVSISLDDWYLYGLAVTDIDLVKEFLRIAQDRLGEALSPGRLGDKAVRKALLDFFSLKETWRFSSRENRLGKYYFSHGEYQIARMEYEKRWKMKPSRFDKILVSLASEFETRDEVLEAETMIEEKIDQFIRAYSESHLRKDD